MLYKVKRTVAFAYTTTWLIEADDDDDATERLFEVGWPENYRDVMEAQRVLDTQLVVFDRTSRELEDYYEEEVHEVSTDGDLPF